MQRALASNEMTCSDPSLFQLSLWMLPDSITLSSQRKNIYEEIPILKRPPFASFFLPLNDLLSP